MEFLYDTIDYHGELLGVLAVIASKLEGVFVALFRDGGERIGRVLFEPTELSHIALTDAELRVLAVDQLRSGEVLEQALAARDQLVSIRLEATNAAGSPVVT